MNSTQYTERSVLNNNTIHTIDNIHIIVRYAIVSLVRSVVCDLEIRTVLVLLKAVLISI